MARDRILNILKGRLGTNGTPGSDGVSPNQVGFNQLTSPLSSLFLNNKIADVVSGGVSWSRQRAATYIDRYGNLAAVGGESIDNLLRYSEDFSQWQDPQIAWSVFATGVSDPLGGNNASTIQIDTSVTSLFMGLSYSTTISGTYTGSFWIKNNTGTVTQISIQKDGSSPAQIIPVAVTSNWQRVSIPYVEEGNGTFYINVTGAPGTKFDLFGAQVNTGSALTDYIATNGSTGSAANPDKIYRANDKGFLIEMEKENLSLWSEDLTQGTWVSADCEVISYSGLDPLDNSNLNIQINSTGQNPTLLNDVTITQGDFYTVSFFAKLISGTVDSVSASLGGLAPEPIEQAITSEWRRFSIKLEAGAAQNFSLIFTNETNASFAVWGVQCELGDLTSYIATAANTVTRDADIASVSAVGNFQNTGNESTMIFNFAEPVENLNGYIFSNNKTGANEYSMRIDNGTISLKIGETTRTINITGNYFALLSFGESQTGSLSVATFYDGDAVPTMSFPASVNILSDTMYIGSNNGLESIDTEISDLFIYDFVLTGSQLRTFFGVNYDD